MSLFDTLGTNQQLTRAQALQQIRANPSAVLKQAGLNLPDGMNDPQQIVMYLLNSGQIGRNLRRLR